MINKIITVFLLSIIGFVFLAVINSSIENQYPSEPLVVEGYEFDYETPDYGTRINDIHVDENYIYVGGLQAVGTLNIYDKNDGSFVTSLPYIGDIFTITTDDNHLYFGGDDQTVHVYDKDTFTLQYQTPLYGGDVRSLLIDETYIYVGGATEFSIKVYDKETQTLQNESDTYSGSITDIETYNNNLFINSGNIVYVLDKTTLVLQYQTPDYGGLIKKIQTDSNYIYVAGLTTNAVRKYNINDGSFIDELPSYGETIEGLYVDNNNIYVGGRADILKVYDKDTYNLIFESPNYGDTINSIVTYDNNLYYAGSILENATVQAYSPITSGGEVETPPLVGLIPIVASIAVIGSVVVYVKFKR